MQVKPFTNGKGADRVSVRVTVADVLANADAFGPEQVFAPTFSPEQAREIASRSQGALREAFEAAGLVAKRARTRQAQGDLAPKRTSVRARPAASPQASAQAPKPARPRKAASKRA